MYILIKSLLQQFNKPSSEIGHVPANDGKAHATNVPCEERAWNEVEFLWPSLAFLIFFEAPYVAGFKHHKQL